MPHEDNQHSEYTQFSRIHLQLNGIVEVYGEAVTVYTSWSPWEKCS
jgi:hypothetical protein